MESKNKKYWSARHERCFRTVVVDENDFRIMEAILSTILKGKVEIKGYLLPNIKIDHMKEKDKTADFIIKLDGEYINLELETGNSIETTHKNMLYFMGMYKQNVVRNEKYDTKTKFLQIILQFNLPLSRDIFEEFYLQSKNNILLPNFKIIRVNMDRVTKIWYSKITKDIKEYKYLIMLDLPRKELEKFESEDKIVAEFKSKIFKLNESEKFQREMTKEEEQALIVNTGKELAFEEGEASGISKGEKQKQLEIAKNLFSLNISKEQIEMATGLSSEEIEKLMVCEKDS